MRRKLIKKLIDLIVYTVNFINFSVFLIKGFSIRRTVRSVERYLWKYTGTSLTAVIVAERVVD